MDPENGTVDDPVWLEIRRTCRLGDRSVLYCESVDSTNTVALAMARDGAARGTVVVAETQTQGRGRLGKKWLSPPATGLYCTVLLRPSISLEHLARLTLAAGLATAYALEEVSGLSCMIKWPNDVLVHGNKVAGILAECDLVAGGCPTVALGIGINLATTQDQLPQNMRVRATSLWLASGRLVGKGQMLSTLLRWVDRVVYRLECGDFAGILGEWKSKDATAAQQLAWLTTDGRTIIGKSLGPDQEGCLLIRDRAGRCHQVMSGDITLDPSTLNGYFP